LGLILITDIYWLDPLVAILVACLIIKESYSLMRKAFNPLLDEAWETDEVEELERNLNEMNVNYHQLRTRIAGNYRFLDLHIELPKDLSVESAHKYCDMVEDTLTSKFQNLNVTIHVEPT